MTPLPKKTGQFRLGIDAGGTFTDFVLSDKTNQVHLLKVKSTPQDGTIAIKQGLSELSQMLGISVEEIIGECDLCINGITVALNALIEKSGAKVGLICTSGHEDSIEIRLGHKEEGYRYDSEYPPAHMLAPRHLRRPVRERVLVDGTIRTTLNENDILDAINYFKKEKIDAVAVSFVWSVVNDVHEKRAKQLVQKLMPEVFVCTGSEVYPQIREYTRTSTAIVNAYLTPVLGKYIQKIDEYFETLGASQPVRYYQSNGGMVIGRSLKERAVNAINSGPASAPKAAMHIAAPFNIKNVITIDMGGTSFDITLTKDGETNINKNIDFLRYRIGVPMIQVETLGAGGGSIASVNEFGMLEVGPKSAGSSPGPVCYGQGGDFATVTDANCVLGYLNTDRKLGGSISLDRDAAAKAIQDQIASPLNISLDRAAQGIFAVVNFNMVSGIRKVTIERGYDPRDFALVCAGGASGMHILGLAEEIGINEVLVPKIASGLCAYGQILSDVKYDYLSTFPTRLDRNLDFAGLNAAFTTLENNGIAQLKNDGVSAGKIIKQRSLELRYVGQIHECTVPISNDTFDQDSMEAILNMFHERHKELYSYCEENSPVELVNIETSIRSPGLPLPLAKGVKRNGKISDAKIGHRHVVLDETCQRVPIPCYDGTKLQPDDSILGPAIIEEPTTTILILPNWSCELHESACYNLRRNVH